MDGSAVAFELDPAAVLEPKVPIATGVCGGMARIRARVCGLDLFGEEFADPALRVPGWTMIDPIAFFNYGLLCFRLVRKYGLSAYPIDESGESVLFKATGDDVLIHSTQTEIVVGLPYAAVDSAWAEFADEVKDRFVARFPAFAADPIWSVASNLDPPASGVAQDWGWISLEFQQRSNAFDRVDRWCGRAN